MGWDDLTCVKVCTGCGSPPVLSKLSLVIAFIHFIGSWWFKACYRHIFFVQRWHYFCYPDWTCWTQPICAKKCIFNYYCPCIRFRENRNHVYVQGGRGREYSVLSSVTWLMDLLNSRKCQKKQFNMHWRSSSVFTQTILVTIFFLYFTYF